MKTSSLRKFIYPVKEVYLPKKQNVFQQNKLPKPRLKAPPRGTPRGGGNIN